MIHLLPTNGLCSRSMSIKNILCRCVLKITADVEASLIEELFIPKTWIAEAKVHFSSYFQISVS